MFAPSPRVIFTSTTPSKLAAPAAPFRVVPPWGVTWTVIPALAPRDSGTGGARRRSAPSLSPFKVRIWPFTEALTSPAWAAAPASSTSANEAAKAAMNLAMIPLSADTHGARAGAS